MNTYTIYAYFNADQIQAVINSIVMLMGSTAPDGDYVSVLRVAGMIGLILAVTMGLVRARGEDAGMYLIMMALFYSILFVPRVTVTIEEKGGYAAGAPVAVDNVPLGLAFFAATTSHIGYWLTERTETMFSLPSTELRLGSHGLFGAARTLRESQSAAMPDPVLAQDMVNFMRDCINPELITSSATVASLMKSTNLWNDFNALGLINPGRMVVLAGSSTVEQCDTAYTTTLGSRLAPAATEEASRIARILSPSAPLANANTMLAAMLPAAESLIMTASASTTEAIRQRMMINMLNDTTSNMAQIMNDPSAAQTALGTAMASSSANAGYRVMAKIAQETLPMVRNAIELAILGVFPIILVLIIIAGSKGGLVLRSYVMTMLWVQLWAPLYAIVNFVGTMAHAKSLKASLAGVDGISISNASALMNTTISGEAIAGILTIAVPMIALAIVKGGEVAMSGVTSSLTSGANSAATRAGGEVGTGNVSMGNTQWGNHSANNASANQSNASFGYTDPGMGTVRGAQGSYSITPQGGFSNVQAYTSNVGASASVGARTGAGHEASSGTEAANSRSSETSLNTGVGGKYTAANVASFAAAFQQIAGQRWGGSEQFKTGDQAANSTEATTGSGLNQGNEQSAGLAVKGQAKLSGQVGVGGTAQQNTTVSRDITPGSQGKPAGTNVKNTSAFNAAENFMGLKNTTGRVAVDASTGGEANTAETRKDGSGTTQSTSDKAQAEKNFAQVRSAAMEVMVSTQNSGVKAAGYQFLGELASSTDAKFGTNTRATLTDKASDGNSRTDGRHADASASLGNAVAQRAIGIYGTPEAAFAAFNNDPVAFGRAVGDPVASRAAMETLPSPGNAVSGIGGSVLSSPKGVQATSAAGKAAVIGDNQGNQSAARSAAAGYQNQADHKGEVPKGMPSQEQATAAFTGVSGEAMSGKAASIAQQRTQRGVTMAAQAINADEQGMSRLMKSALGGGAFEFFGLNNGGKETQAQLNRLAQNSPEVRASLDQLAARGGAPTVENINNLNAALSTYQNKLSEQYGQDWRSAIQNAGEDLFGGKP